MLRCGAPVAPSRCLQVSTDEVCPTCSSGLKKYECTKCPTGTRLCPCNKRYYDCPIHNGIGKVVSRGKTCLHDRRKGRCQICQAAEKLTGKPHFFGKREREAAAKAAADGAA